MEYKVIEKNVPIWYINADYMCTKEYDSFIDKGSKYVRLYTMLYRYIIRGDSKNGPLGTLLYNEFYLNNKLTSRYNQSDMACYLGIQQPAVSKILKRMEKDGYIIKQRINFNNKNIVLYQLGEIQNGKELIFLKEKLKTAYIKEVKERTMSKLVEEFGYVHKKTN